MQQDAEQMYADYLAAGGLGVLGSVEYFRQVAEAAAAHDEEGK